ncbi:MAG TPA: MFS transporter, partial [Candidatus Saccharimonadales bacterium]|nr:MFS transporter [Candidatus Saccharimonadales bacterium]
LTLWLMRGLAPEPAVQGSPKIDSPGAVLCTLGLGGTVFALIEQPSYGWGSPAIWLPLICGLLLLVSFVWYERRTPQPMLPLSLFKRRNFSVGNIATAAIYGGLSIATFLIVIYLQQVGGFSALHAGIALLPVTVVMFLLSPRFGALAGRTGPRLFMALGPMVAAGGFLLMLRVRPELVYLTQLLPGVLLFALGLSMTVAPLTAAILGDVDTGRAGVASAVNNAVSRIAGLITVAALGLITGPHLSPVGFRRALIATAILMTTGGIISLIGIRNPHRA